MKSEEPEGADELSGSSEDGAIPPGPVLFLVAVPIGNLRDITLRALDVFAACDHVVCEDTRSTRRLLSAHGLRAELLSFRPTHRDADSRRAIEALRGGERLAFCSEAGTPALSDPGSFLVREVRAHCPDVPIVPIPGASAVTAALSVAGFQTNPCLYLGFPSPKAGRRQALLKEHAGFPGVIVLFESVHRARAALADLRTQFPDREILIARELTKKFESIQIWEPGCALPEDLTLRGEFTLVVGPRRRKNTPFAFIAGQKSV